VLLTSSYQSSTCWSVDIDAADQVGDRPDRVPLYLIKATARCVRICC
jgi:hypothetical protein